MLDSPLITVTIPCYRQGNSLKNAIDSVLNQTYENLEILIFEDPSDRDSSEVIKGYQYDNRVKYFKHPSRVGRVKNYQSIFKEISGVLAVNLDGDDYFVNKFYIERCAQEFLKDPNLVLSVSGIRVNQDGVTHELFPNISEEVVYLSGRDYFLDSLLDKTRTNHHFAMVYRVDVAKRIGFYIEDIASTDLESFRRLVLHGNVVQINQISGVWNIGDASISWGLSCLDYANNSRFITNPLLEAKKNNQI